MIPVSAVPPDPKADEYPSQYYYESNVLFNFDNLRELQPGAYPAINNANAKIYREILANPVNGITTGITLIRTGTHWP